MPKKRATDPATHPDPDRIRMIQQGLDGLFEAFGRPSNRLPEGFEEVYMADGTLMIRRVDKRS